jgi:hypothetical protein
MPRDDHGEERAFLERAGLLTSLTREIMTKDEHEEGKK